MPCVTVCVRHDRVSQCHTRVIVQLSHGRRNASGNVATRPEDGRDSDRSPTEHHCRLPAGRQCLEPPHRELEVCTLHLLTAAVLLRRQGVHDGNAALAVSDGSWENADVVWARESASHVATVVSPVLCVDTTCLLYTSDAADEEDSVDLGGRRIIKKKKKYEQR
eukprot:TRINITY_DN18188_c0_g1_i1.p1 TRINITY_DN18188_c0_g1~~TRINITY_DN18188_c0_g1_i1.p1  ORF type:complete len:164 (-),score=26.85 TRINITY_DN18188_c0_g1_i1:110-601(-)